MKSILLEQFTIIYHEFKKTESPYQMLLENPYKITLAIAASSLSPKHPEERTMWLGTHPSQVASKEMNNKFSLPWISCWWATAKSGRGKGSDLAISRTAP